jgi:hypothetical protein
MIKIHCLKTLSSKGEKYERQWKKGQRQQGTEEEIEAEPEGKEKAEDRKEEKQIPPRLMFPSQP